MRRSTGDHGDTEGWHVRRSSEPGGTAYRSGDLGLGGSRLAGKTGTAQVRRISAEERARAFGAATPLRASCATTRCSWPMRRRTIPKYAVSVIVEHGEGGSRTAAPVGRDILAAAIKMDSGRTPTYAKRAATGAPDQRTDCRGRPGMSRDGYTGFTRGEARAATARALQFSKFGPLGQVARLPWSIILLIVGVGLTGAAMLFSVGWDPVAQAPSPEEASPLARSPLAPGRRLRHDDRARAVAAGRLGKTGLARLCAVVLVLLVMVDFSA
jgi:hypothetical protein